MVSNHVRLLPDQFLSQIESRIALQSERLLDSEGIREMGRLVMQYVAQGGKRIRPQLAVWTFVHSAPVQQCDDVRIGDLPVAILDLATGWELFHAFLLVHDDIIDGADTRRGQPALHVSLASLDSNSPRFGQHLGIVAGDLLFTAAMEIWHELDLEPKTYRDLMRLLSRVARVTGVGQAIDILASHLPLALVDEETLMREYLYKTAAYTFEGPMLSGAILAGLSAPAQQAISTFALALGQAYQLQNDLIDLNQSSHEGSDLVQGKRTVTLIRHRNRLAVEARTRLDDRLDRIASAGPNAIALADMLRIDLLSEEVMQPTHQLIRCLLDSASLAAQDPALPSSLRHELSLLLHNLIRVYFLGQDQMNRAAELSFRA